MEKGVGRISMRVRNDSIIGPRREKTCLRTFANNKGADQPAHPRNLISAFVFAFLKVSYPNMPQTKFQLSS